MSPSSEHLRQKIIEAYKFGASSQENISPGIANVLAGNGATILRELSSDPKIRTREEASRQRYTEQFGFRSFIELQTAYLDLIYELRSSLGKKSWETYFIGYDLRFEDRR